ncbi:MAG: SAM-dependent methyltransferase, partial [Bacteroidia bacterium]|nr:SAM-dependent methyltransferase [Bacteroidia bacterium]
EPNLRHLFAQKISQLLKPSGKYVGLLFNRDFETNPPFGGSLGEYEDIFSPYLEIKIIAECYNSHPKRAGTELFFRFQKV